MGFWMLALIGFCGWPAQTCPARPMVKDFEWPGRLKWFQLALGLGIQEFLKLLQFSGQSLQLADRAGRCSAPSSSACLFLCSTIAISC
jgi:hypothetical protein